MDIATTLYNLGRKNAHANGRTVELDLSATAYTGPHTDRIFYGTPENEGVNMSISHSLTEGKMAVYVTPEHEAKARKIIAELEAA